MGDLTTRQLLELADRHRAIANAAETLRRHYRLGGKYHEATPRRNRLGMVRGETFAPLPGSMQSAIYGALGVILEREERAAKSCEDQVVVREATGG